MFKAILDSIKKVNKSLARKRPEGIPVIVPDCGWNHGENQVKIATENRQGGTKHDR